MRPFLAVLALLVACKSDHQPIIGDVADHASAEGDAVDVQLTGTDPKGDALTWSATGLPPGTEIDATTGRITGTLTFDAAAGSPYTIDVIAGDSEAEGTTQFEWTVANTDRPPLIDAIADAIIAEDESLDLTFTGTDPDGEVITWSADGLPDTLTVDPTTGDVLGSTTYDDAGEWPITVYATTPSGEATTTFTLTVSNTDRAPTLEVLPNLTNAVGDVIHIDFRSLGADPDGDYITWYADGFPPGLGMGIPGILDGTITGGAGTTFSPYLELGSGSLRSPTRQFSWTITGGPCALGFTDVTSTAGITGTVSHSVLWLDADNDGDQDVYIGGNSLFINNGTGGFSAAASGIAAAMEFQDLSNAVADFDNDGDLDLFIGGDTRYRTVGNRMLINDGTGNFTDKSTTWGVTFASTTPSGTAAIDYDGDNWLDLAESTSFGPPHLWRNTGTPPFANATSNFPGNFQGDALVFGDVTGDGAPDAYQSTGTPGDGNFLYRWTGTTYLEEGLARGVLDDPTGSGRWGGATLVDFDHDGDLDLHSIRDGLPDLVYMNDGTGTFSPATIASIGLGDAEMAGNIAWADADLDGDLDVFVPSRGVYRNDGTGHFAQTWLATVGTHGAWADLDGDGDLDLVTANDTTAVRVWRNDTVTAECTGAGAIEVRALTDRDGDATDATVTDDRDAIGADVWVDLDDDGDFAAGGTDSLVRYTVGPAMSGREVLNQLPLVIGLGSHPRVDVRVRFPDGTVVNTLDVVEGDAIDVLDR